VGGLVRLGLVLELDVRDAAQLGPEGRSLDPVRDGTAARRRGRHRRRRPRPAGALPRRAHDGGFLARLYRAGDLRSIYAPLRAGLVVRAEHRAGGVARLALPAFARIAGGSTGLRGRGRRAGLDAAAWA